MLTPKNITLNRNFIEKNEIKDKNFNKGFHNMALRVSIFLSVSKQINIFA